MSRPLACVVAAVVMMGLAAGAFALGTRLVHGGVGAQEVRTYGPGWVNMSTLDPTQPIAQAVSPYAGKLAAVYYLDPATGGWLRYFPDRPSASNLTTMVFGESYLMLFTAPVAVTMLTEETFYGLLAGLYCPPATSCDLDEVCDAIHDLTFQYNLAVPILDQQSLEWLLLTMAVDDLDDWYHEQCW
jgi:hypothetical protein